MATIPERFIRWQTIRLQQLGYVNNLFNLLTSGSLLWQVQILFSNPTTVVGHQSFFLGTILFFFSMIIGCYIAWNRLIDFSLTADRLRSLMETPSSVADQETKSFRKEMKEESAKLGKITRKWLPIQLITFLIGTFFVALDIILHIPNLFHLI